MMEKQKEKDLFENSSKMAIAEISNQSVKNIQNGSEATKDGMELLLYKAGRVAKVPYEQCKGNLFEYIEGAKLNKNMANEGIRTFDKNPITDLSVSKGGFGENTAPDDFRMIKKGKIIAQAQAKFNNNPRHAAVNLANSKYSGMQRIVPSDQIDAVKDELNKMVDRGEISIQQYKDTIDNLHEGLTDRSSGVASGGTTTRELEQLRGKDGKLSQEAVKNYVRNIKAEQYVKDIGNTSASHATAQAVVTGIVTAVNNLWDVYKDRKKLDEALKDVGVKTTRAGAKGGIVGALSAIFRIGGKEFGVPIISNASAATVVAAGVIDMGVILYDYAEGKISEEQLMQGVRDTAVKATTTIYYTKAISLALGVANPLIPIAVYTVSSYFVACAREIMNKAELNKNEYERLAIIHRQGAEIVREYRIKLEEQIRLCVMNQQNTFKTFLISFDESLMAEEGHLQTVGTIIDFASQIGMQLQHVNFKEFDSAIRSNKTFVLK